MSSKLGWSSAAVVALMMVSSPVQACPYCAGHASGGLAFSIVLGAILLIPFLIVGAVVHFVRRGAAEPSRLRGGPA